MNRKNVVLIASAMLALGVFCPAIQIPIAGSINYFANGGGDGVLVLLLAASAVPLAFRNRIRLVLVPAILVLGICLFDLFHLLWIMHSVKEHMTAEMEGNPFSGLAVMMLDSFQVSWGWVLMLGAGVALFCAGLSSSSDVLPDGRVIGWRSALSPAAGKLSRTFVVGSFLTIFAWAAVQMFGHNRASEVLGAMRSQRSGDPAVRDSAETAPKEEEKVNKDFSKTAITIYSVRGFMGHGTVKCTDSNCPTVEGKIRNDTTETYSRVELTASFRDSNGKVIYEDTSAPVTSGMFSDNSMPLKPGFIRAFGWVVPDCPSECVAVRLSFGFPI